MKKEKHRKDKHLHGSRPVKPTSDHRGKAAVKKEHVPSVKVRYIQKEGTRMPGRLGGFLILVSIVYSDETCHTD